MAVAGKGATIETDPSPHDISLNWFNWAVALAEMISSKTE